jgi:hypothetical protein
MPYTVPVDIPMPPLELTPRGRRTTLGAEFIPLG